MFRRRNSFVTPGKSTSHRETVLRDHRVRVEIRRVQGACVCVCVCENDFVAVACSTRVFHLFRFRFQMRTPAIQNDFSYYRRVLMREGASVHSFTDQDEDSNSNLNVANKVSLFYAEATPMLRTLSNVTSQYLNKVCFFYYDIRFFECQLVRRIVSGGNGINISWKLS